MNTKSIIAVAALFAVIFASGVGFAVNVTITSPTHGTATTDTTPEITFHVNASNHTANNFVRVFVNGAVNVQLNVTNSTSAKYNLSAQADGVKKLKVEVWNQTGDNGDKNGTAFNSTEVNLTVDATVPSLTVDQPTEGTEYVVSDTDNRLTIDLNITVSDATIGLDVCRYEIFDVDTGTPVAHVANTTITACAASTAITPSSGNNILNVHANDTQGNAITVTRQFRYRVQSIGGAGTSGGSSGSVTQPTSTTSGGTRRVPASIATTTGTASAGGQIPSWVILLVIGGGVYYYATKKKRRR